MSDIHGRQAYAAYGAMTGGKNYQGNPMPPFDGLGDVIQRAWIAAANAVRGITPPEALASFACAHCPETFPSQMDRIEHLLLASIGEEEKIMTDVAKVAADFDKYKTDVQAAFARLQASVDAGNADAQALADLDTAINGADADAVAEDPAPAAPVDATPVDAGDGTADSGDAPVAEGTDEAATV